MRAALLPVLSLVLAAGAAAQEAVELKIATVAPEGSTWMKVFREADVELRRATRGQVGFKYYPGGIMGDELQVIERLEEGRIDGAAFSGLGIGRLLPEIRILELPLLFASYEEYDHVVAGLTPLFERRLADEGWHLLGLAEGGFAHVFSVEAVRTLDDLRAARLWGRAGDPLLGPAFRALAIDVEEVPLSGVVERLDDGRLDAVYSSPLTLIAFQWFPYLEHRVDIRLFNLQAAYVIRKSAHERIPERHRDRLARIAAEHVERLIKASRADNEEALALLEGRGYATTTLDPASRAELQRRADAFAAAGVGSLYDQVLYDRMMALRTEFRARR